MHVLLTHWLLLIGVPPNGLGTLANVALLDTTGAPLLDTTGAALLDARVPS